jgi:cytoskeletal protein CcmA (bactofilin family)
MLRARDTGGADGPTVIGPRLAVTGDLAAEDAVEVRGSVDGTVVAPHVTIAAGGRIDGSVVARTLTIAGTVSGRAEALSVTIEASAEVSGSVVHHEIEVRKGAKIDGPMPWRPKGYFDEAPPPVGSGKPGQPDRRR